MSKHLDSVDEKRKLLLTAAEALPGFRRVDLMEIDTSGPMPYRPPEPGTFEPFFEYMRVRELHLAWDALYWMAMKVDASHHFWSLLVQAGEPMGLDGHENMIGYEKRLAGWMADARRRSQADSP
jgi:hypothetical protein